MAADSPAATVVPQTIHQRLREAGIMESALVEQPAGSDAQWFASWFDSVHYHKLYAHRDAAEAARFVEALVARLKPPAGSSMLDLGCGAGRHARHLAAGGFDVTGLDLAARSIEAARRFEGRALRFRQHDMRVPFGRRAFDYVFSFFTSFGYFDDPAEQLTVVRNMARALKPGGRLVLDYLNTRYADEHLTPYEVKEVDGVAYRIRRWTDGRRFFKRIVVDEGGAETPIEYREQVARFSLADFERMFAAQGLDIVELYGDYQLSTYDPRTSPRLILVARKCGMRREEGYLRERFLRTRLIVSGETPR
jgi:SAM-dependent methyltransferase